ncbi:MAG: carbon-nitrogen family hydrolase [Saprospiraceae bacterium]|nr:carbon-nitrogen family hydrolase [Saprospiraceae bacterium]
MKIAIAQIACSTSDVERNLEKIARISKDCSCQGVQLVVFPELVDTGYVMEEIEARASSYQSGGPLESLKEIARSNDIFIIAGITEREKDKIFNSAVVVDPSGDLIANYRKIHLYTPSGEDVFHSGDNLVTVPIDDFTLGLMICYDLRFPEMARSLAIKGAEVLIVPTAWPFPRVEHWQLLTRVRALENQCYLIGANRVGRDGKFTLCGNSRIVDPHGVIVSSASEDQEEVIVGELEKDKIDFIRKRMPVFSHRRSDIYEN